MERYTHVSLSWFFTVLLVIAGFLGSPGNAQAQSCSTSVTNKVGDTITVTGTLSTTDPNENGEGEPLLLSSSGGDFTAVVSAYFVPTTFTYTATRANETITGTNVGFDFDESCTVTASANQPHLLSQAQKNFFAGLATGLAVPAGGFWTVSELCALTIIGGPICSIPSGLAAAGFATAAALSGLISLDPIDPNFTQIATPVIPSIPPFTGISPAVSDAFNALLANEAEIVGIEGALYTTLNRASGASAAGNTFWLNAQLQAATGFEGQLSRLLNKETTLLATLQGALQVAGVTATITPDQVLNFESVVAFGGLPADDVSALKQFGADASLIQQITDLAFVQDINAVAGNFPQLLTKPSLISLLGSLTVGPPTTKNDCKDDLWQAYNTPESFKNQGDCIQFVNTGK